VSPSSKPKPYQYRNQNRAAPDYDYGQTVIRTGNEEVLSGQIHGMKASDIEERAARALDKLAAPYDFRVRISSDVLGQRRLTREFANVRGEIELDFIVELNGRVVPIFVDGSISHFFTPAQAEADKIKTNAANEFGSRMGWHEAVRIPFWQLQDQDTADRTIRNIFL
jgi:hypothetical protein